MVIRVEKYTQLFFKSLVIILSLNLISCESHIDVDLPSNDKVSNTLFLSMNDPINVQLVENITIENGKTVELYSVLSRDNETYENVPVKWSLIGDNGILSVTSFGKHATFTANKLGSGSIQIEDSGIIKRVTINVVAPSLPVTTNINVAEGIINSESLITLKYTDPNGDKATSCTLSNLTNLSITTACSCNGIGVCSVGITGDTNYSGSASFDFIVNADGDISNLSTVNITIKTCPSGYVSIPGNSTLGTTSFCVMQFEAKNIAGVATSQAANTPWTGINSINAYTECSNLTEVGFTGSFSLISNPEWMTIARNIESYPPNWSGGNVGSGHIPRGHSDGSPGGYLSVTNTLDPYDGTGNSSGQSPGSGWEQKRTHTLTNGSTLWDLAGNVWEWTDWNMINTGFSIGPTNENTAIKELSIDPIGSLTFPDYKPNNDTYNSTNNSFGIWRGGSGGNAIRGGNTGGYGGVYTLDLFQGLGTHPNIGFRCVYRPAQAPVAKNFSAPNPYENTERLITLDYYDVNHDLATACSVENLTNVTETTPCSCNGSGICTVGITGINNYSGPASFEFNVTADGLKSNNALSSFSINAGIPCPTGFIHVAGNGSLGTNDFCVMQYEAKNNAGTPISQASGTPWVNINANDAFSECASMSEGGFSGEFALISNPEWMTIAREIENINQNWTGGNTGQGCVFRGNSGETTVGTGSNLGDSCGYNGSDPEFGTGRDLRSKLYLSSLDSIHDFAGNVFEWVDWTSSTPGYQSIPSGCSGGYQEIPPMVCGTMDNDDYKPSNLSFDSNQGMGQSYGGTNAIYRGGRYLSGDASGIYNIKMNDGSTFSHGHVGFRCVYRP